ncbi:hypothetical protein OG613_46880 (plasmid) [Streptomyces sp. NBC_00015]|uniref:hypothetical protein n=1 Tax=Streptomyces sp. NBC_00015 TaxID=2903611 RepID=UPI00324B74C1
MQQQKCASLKASAQPPQAPGAVKASMVQEIGGKIVAMMATSTQRLLDLAAAAAASHDEDRVLLLLTEASGSYEQGFHDALRTVTARVAVMSSKVLVTAVHAAGLPCDGSQDRAELVSLLALTEWDMAPAALAYSEMAEDAARRGVCLIPQS